MRSSFFTSVLVMVAVLHQHATSVAMVDAGQVMSHLIPGRQASEGRHPPPVSHLDWNSQVATGFSQRPLHNHPAPPPPPSGQAAHPSPPVVDLQQQQQPSSSSSSSNRGEVDCPTNDRVYLPDMQSFLIRTRMSYADAMAVCRACGSELVLVDGSNVDRLRESFQSLGGLYAGQRFWIKS
ncbi:hypothetical protein DFQ26_000295, partial [Actinomortierella ambigua]